MKAQTIHPRHSTLSPARTRRLKQQGYLTQTDQQIADLAFGNRFAFILCTTLMGIGVALANVPLLGAMTLVAFGGFVLPYHPFDYLYDHGVRHLVNRPALPRRSRQLKFACMIATAWLAGVTFLFLSGHLMAGYIGGTLLFAVAFTVSTTDYCIPSVIYNFLFGVKVDR